MHPFIRSGRLALDRHPHFRCLLAVAECCAFTPTTMGVPSIILSVYTLRYIAMRPKQLRDLLIAFRRRPQLFQCASYLMREC